MIDIKYDLTSLEDFFNDEYIAVKKLEKEIHDNDTITAIHFGIPTDWVIPEIYTKKDNEIGVNIITAESDKPYKDAVAVSTSEDFTILAFHIVEISKINIEMAERNKLIQEYQEKLNTLDLETLKKLSLNVVDEVTQAVKPDSIYEPELPVSEVVDENDVPFPVDEDKKKVTVDKDELVKSLREKMERMVEQKSDINKTLA